MSNSMVVAAPRFVSWAEQQAAELRAARAYLDALGFKVRASAPEAAPISFYWVSAHRRALDAPGLIALAKARGFVVDGGRG